MGLRVRKGLTFWNPISCISVKLARVVALAVL